jgi:hypothetical protein
VEPHEGKGVFCKPALNRGQSDQRLSGSAQTALSPAAFALDRHKRASRALLSALTLADEHPAIWNETAFILAARLTPQELAGLAFAALLVLHPDERNAVLTAPAWGAT